LRVSNHRLDALTDGLFAIVMTLLVLELKVPELPTHAATGGDDPRGRVRMDQPEVQLLRHHGRDDCLADLQRQTVRKGLNR
jgi:hypothetical protein